MNMKSKLFSFYVLIICIFQSCSGNDYDTLIEKYSQEDFSCLQGVFMNKRGRDNNGNIVIIVCKRNFKCSPYIVTINNKSGEILKIDDKLPIRDCNGYFSNNEIGNFVKCFLKYKFEVLSVDLNGDVYINPFQQDLPILLRRQDKYSPQDITGFKIYKQNWYIKNNAK